MSALKTSPRPRRLCALGLVLLLHWTGPLANVHAANSLAAWGYTSYGAATIPAWLTNPVVAIASGSAHNLVVASDGTVAGWGDPSSGQNAIPIGLTNVLAIVDGAGHSLALTSEGMVVAWGSNESGQTAVPPGTTNVVAIAAGVWHSLALKGDGTVVAWGRNIEGQTDVPAGLREVIAIAGGEQYSLALKRDGTVVSWGAMDLPASGTIDIPPDLTNVVAIAGGQAHCLALKADGTVVGWGLNWDGRARPPAGLTNVVALAAGGSHSLALKSDGTVVGWGYNIYDQATAPPGLTNIVAIAAGYSYHSLGLMDNSPVFLAAQPVGQTTLVGGDALLAVRARGTGPLSYQWQRNESDLPGATQPLLALTNLQTGLSGSYRVVVTNAFGAVTSAVAVLTVLDGPPIITVQPQSQVVASGADVTFSVSAIGSEPLFYQWQFEWEKIPGETNAWLTLSNVDETMAGQYTVIVYNEYGKETSAGAMLQVVPFDRLLESGNLAWRTGGDAPWFGQTNVAHDGVDAAQSRAITHRQQSWLETTVEGPGTLSFWWRVSSETNSDWLSFSTNGAAQASLSGETDWQQQVVYLAEGPQTLRWTYAKSARGTSGQDAGWLDEVSYQPGATAAQIVTQPTPQLTVSAATEVSFSIAAIGTPPLRYQWQFNGTNLPAATNATLSLGRAQPPQSGTYAVVVANDYGTALSSNALLTVWPVLAWGLNIYGQTAVPAGLTNVLAVAAGWNHSLALRQGGTVVAWGRNSEQERNVPAGLNSVVALAAGGYHSLALRSNGTVTAWGFNNQGQCNVLSGLTGCLGIAAGGYFSLALKADGTVVGWGANDYGQTTIPPGLTNVSAIAAGGHHALALKTDGTVVAWGRNDFQQISVPPDVTNVVAIVAGHQHSVALRQDGTVRAWGWNARGETDVPAGLSNVVALAGIGYHTLALKADGSVVSWGFGSNGETNVPPGLTNVVSVAGGWGHSLVVVGPQAPTVLVQPTNRTVYSRMSSTFRVAASGSLPLSYQWEFNGTALPGATSATLVLTNPQYADAGSYRVVVSNPFGAVTSAVAALTVRMPLEEALDTSGVAWETGGSAPWFGQTNVTHDGEDAMQSGPIGNYQTSLLQAYVTGPGTLNFWWKVSSESGLDTLTLRISGILQASLSGEVDWRQETFYVPDGLRILLWRYVKDGSGSSGQDAGWLDQVTFTPGGTAPILVTAPASQSVLAGTNVTFSGAAVGTPPLSYQWRKDGTNLAGATNATLLLTNVHRVDSGRYAIIVTNAFGSALGEAALAVRAPQRLRVLASAAGGGFRIESGDADGGQLPAEALAGFEVHASTNLVDWTPLADGLTITNGRIIFNDAESTNYPTRFYRIIEH